MICSIVVPIYNVDLYLNECIQSVLKQKEFNWELILVDDGSFDKCPTICDEYASLDKRIKVVHKQNGGLVSARKAGLEIANGDYIMCLDGDDFLHTECLSIIYEQIRKFQPDIICFGKYNYCVKGNISVPIRGYSFGYFDHKRLEKEFYHKFICSKKGKSFSPNLWSKVYKKNIYKKYQYSVPDSVTMGEDGACTRPLIANISSMVLIPDCLYYYRQVPTSMTKAKKSLSWDNFDMIYDLYQKEIDCDKFGFREQFYRLRTHNLFNICMSQFYSGKSYNNITKEIRDRFEEHPEYDNAIKNSNFTSITMKFTKYVLMYRCFWIMYLYASFRDTIRKLKL